VAEPFDLTEQAWEIIDLAITDAGWTTMYGDSADARTVRLGQAKRMLTDPSQVDIRDTLQSAIDIIEGA
jgi:hypothetical protein